VSAVGFQSDSQVLVETCLARLRADARLDDHPVLPAIEDLLPYGSDRDDEVMEVGTDEIIVTVEADIPSASSIVREAAAANAKERRETPTARKDRSANRARPVRWPVLLCALVATYCGVTAFLRSPAAAKPEVQEVVKASRAGIAGAIGTAKSLVAR
jgi:hypothetical protein